MKTDDQVMNHLRARVGLNGPTPDGPWVCGGAVLRSMTGEEGGDVDLFFRDAAQLEEWRHEGGVSWVEHDRFYIPNDAPHIQCIREFFPSMSAVLDSFDFDVCRVGWDGASITASVAARKAASGDRQVALADRIPHPYSTWARVFKYAARGYTFELSDIQRVLDLSPIADPWSKPGSDRSSE